MDDDAERAELVAELDAAVAALQEARRIQAAHPFMRDEDLPPDLLGHVKETLRLMDAHGFGRADPSPPGSAKGGERAPLPERNAAR